MYDNVLFFCIYRIVDSSFQTIFIIHIVFYTLQAILDKERKQRDELRHLRM